MHDTAVGTANFYGVRASSDGRGKQVAGDRAAADTRANPWHATTSNSRRRRLPGCGTSERSPDAELPVVRLGCGMIRFNNCLWATLQDVRKLLSPK